MVKRATKKQRGRYSQKRRRIILVATEGGNRTEKTYLQELNRSIKDVNIVYADGNSTDPINMIEDAIKTAKKKGIDGDYGDRVYIVFDADFNKENQIAEARKKANKNGYQLVVSNPCFEVWLLLHFRYSTKGYNSNDDVINDLRNRWPEYCKSLESFRHIGDRIDVAIDNSKKLMKHHDAINPKTTTEKRNPSTDVHMLIEEILYGKEEDNEK